MRIGLNLLYLIPGVVGGTETYAVSLIKALAEIDQDNEYFVFVNQESSLLELTDAPNFHRIVCKFHATRRVVRYAWEQLLLPSQVRHYRLDLLHSLGYFGPLATPCPSIVTSCDLNYIALRSFIPAVRRCVVQFFSTQAAKRSAHVITISDFSKREICRFMRLDSDRVTVTHLGPGWSDSSGDASLWSAIQDLYHLPQPYVVAFGGGSMHKNIPRLIKAFGKISKDFPHTLVLFGQLPSGLDPIQAATEAGATNHIKVLGYVPRTHISPLLGHADLFVLPSLYEGFGMPVLEAQQADVAIVCSSAGSLPEVAGEGAVFFDPLSVDDMAKTMHRCLIDSVLRAKLRRLGSANVKRFRWEKTAQETLAVYEKVYATNRQL